MAHGSTLSMTSAILSTTSTMGVPNEVRHMGTHRIKLCGCSVIGNLRFVEGVRKANDADLTTTVGDSLPEVVLRMLIHGVPVTRSSSKILGSGRVGGKCSCGWSRMGLHVNVIACI